MVTKLEWHVKQYLARIKENAIAGQQPAKKKKPKRQKKIEREACGDEDDDIFLDSIIAENQRLPAVEEPKPEFVRTTIAQKVVALY